MKRILVFGSGGQVGQALFSLAHPTDLDLIPCPRAMCDLTDHAATQKKLNETRPDLVINAAAMTNVDACEKDRAAAEAANFAAPANLAAQCATRDIPLIHLSTDYVFDGKDGDVPYAEDAAMNPLSVYADTKMTGEIAIQQSLAWHVILRVSSVFSAYGQNIMVRALANLASRDELRLVTDQISCPTYAPDIAETLLTIARGIFQGVHGTYGLFHYCGTPAVNRLQFVEAIMKAYESYTPKRPHLLPARSSDFPGFAERPSYSVLNCDKIKRIYGIGQKDWRAGVTETLAILQRNGALPV